MSLTLAAKTHSTMFNASIFFHKKWLQKGYTRILSYCSAIAVVGGVMKKHVNNVNSKAVSCITLHTTLTT